MIILPHKWKLLKKNAWTVFPSCFSADYQIEDSTNTNDFQQSDSNVSSDFAKDKPVYQENNSVEFQQGDNANQQWTNEQDEAAPVTDQMETETSTHNGHSAAPDEVINKNCTLP